jgi:hypothetical protein
MPQNVVIIGINNKINNAMREILAQFLFSTSTVKPRFNQFPIIMAYLL